MRKLLFSVLGSTLALSAQAYDKIPKEEGFSGFVFFGASANSLESNTLAKVAGTEVSDESIDSLTSSPDNKDYSRVLVDFGLSYTFADSRTQIFGGTELEDFLTQDSTFGIGVRQGVGSLGNLRASLLASTPTEVWEDPYVVGFDRDETDQKSSGVRLGWEHILESDFDVTYTQRKIELDDERSGTFLGLSGAQQDLLNREGDLKQLDVSYRWSPSHDHILIPTLSYVNHDLDGDAMSQDGYQFQLNYAYLGLQNWELVANVLAGKLESDDTNPIYGKTEDVDRYGVSLAATLKEPFGLKDWRLRTAVNYGEQDSNIDFYDTSIKSFAVGMMYSF